MQDSGARRTCAAARKLQSPHVFTNKQIKKLSNSIKEYHAAVSFDKKIAVAKKISEDNKGKSKGHCTDKTKILRRLNMKGKKLHPVTRKWITVDEFNAL